MPVPDYADRRPVKTQIAAHVRAQIRSGAYGPGDRLPAVRDMASSYGVATETIRAALDELRREKIVESQSTRGTFVLRVPAEDESSPDAGALAETVAQLQQRLAELEQNAGLTEARVIELYGLTGNAYPEGGSNGTEEQQRRHGSG